LINQKKWNLRADSTHRTLTQSINRKDTCSKYIWKSNFPKGTHSFPKPSWRTRFIINTVCLHLMHNGFDLCWNWKSADWKRPSKIQLITTKCGFLKLHAFYLCVFLFIYLYLLKNVGWKNRGHADGNKQFIFLREKSITHSCCSESNFQIFTNHWSDVCIHVHHVCRYDNVVQCFSLPTTWSHIVLSNGHHNLLWICRDYLFRIWGCSRNEFE
jgi:hypothetical protein